MQKSFSNFFLLVKRYKIMNKTGVENLLLRIQRLDENLPLSD